MEFWNIDWTPVWFSVSTSSSLWLLERQFTLQFDLRLSLSCSFPSGSYLIWVLCEDSCRGYNLSSKSVVDHVDTSFNSSYFLLLEKCLESFLGPLLLGLSSPGKKLLQTWLLFYCLFLVSCRHCPEGQGKMVGSSGFRVSWDRAEKCWHVFVILNETHRTSKVGC